MSNALAATPCEPEQAWLPGFAHPVRPPDAVGPLLRLPVLQALPDSPRRFALLLLGRDRYVGDLAGEVPLLFGLMLFSTLRRVRATRGPHREAVLDLGCRLARMPRTVLLGALDLDARPAVIRFLARCGYHSLRNPEGRRRLAGACSWWWDEWMTRWQVPHLYLLTTVEPRFWRPVALTLDKLIEHEPSLTMDDGSRIQPGGLCGVPVPKRYRAAIDRLLLLVRCIDDAGLAAPERDALFARMQHCRSLAEVVQFGAGLNVTVAATLRQTAARMNTPLPALPHPGTSWIRPLDTLRRVIEEGQQMRHCLGYFYLGRIAAGEYCAYRVVKPEPLTVGLARSEDGGWRLEQVRGPGNRAAPAYLVARIERWLAGDMDYDNLLALQEDLRAAIAAAENAKQTAIIGGVTVAVRGMHERLHAMSWTDVALGAQLRRFSAAALDAILGTRYVTASVFLRVAVAMLPLEDAQSLLEKALAER
jgi:hypothetical protein